MKEKPRQVLGAASLLYLAATADRQRIDLLAALNALRVAMPAHRLTD
jgi:hypothetical protein